VGLHGRPPSLLQKPATYLSSFTSCLDARRGGFLRARFQSQEELRNSLRHELPTLSPGKQLCPGKHVLGGGGQAPGVANIMIAT
jgi:hypothetical protein